MLKKYSIPVIFLILGALLISACGTAAYAQTPPDNTTPPRTLQVTGNGQVYVTPDIAYVTIGVHTEGQNAADAVASNNTQATAVRDELKNLGVADKDVQTTNFSISPQQKFDDKGNLISTTYVVDNSVYDTVRDLSKIGDLLDAVVKSGANNITGVQFDVADKAAALSQARQQAVADARTQAQELAQAAGVTLGPIQTINVYNNGPQPVFMESKGLGAAAGANVPVSMGQLSVSVQVNIVYQIQ
jgi:uncharacterized protein YggE